ncbi:hypothetical protein ACFO9E_34395 [Streptomyces maoxianensis]|uniref:Golvesin/Xly CBD-like domain-containing protein n=1 Tax=Streptomyces maoxianensis TaxID=1459942 RepID=A0ABV9GI44_9ACTN
MSVPLTLPAQAAEPAPPKGAANGMAKPKGSDKDYPSAIPGSKRKEIAGSADDRVLTTSGDVTGFHLLTAEGADGYGWKTAATLSETGFDTDAWIGNACVTGSGKRAAVAYAPRTFTNKPELMVRGAFTAIVDLESGKVAKLPYQASLAHFSPGCGTGEQVVFTQLSHDGDETQQTRLITVNAATGRTGKPVTYPGQVTSAIPTRHGIIAAHGNKLVTATSKGKLTTLTATASVPFEITADSTGGVTFIDRTMDTKKKASTSYAKHLTATQIGKGKTKAATLASGKLTEWDLTGTADGTVFITGNAKNKARLPSRVKNPGGIAKGARMSSHGNAAITTAWADGKDTRIRPEEDRTERTARTTLRVLDTGKTVTLDAHPGKKRIGGVKASKAASAPSPALPQPKSTEPEGVSTQALRTSVLTASPTDPVEEERYCAVARNDHKKQAFQPTPRQVEWAVDQAVVGKLDFYREPNWKNTGTGGYTPQNLFPPILLAGDPNGTLDTEDGDNDRWHIPAQILLGITAQESNMWQATRFAVPGVTANSLIGNYYGTDYAASGEQLDPWRINWADADCGYGITQATDGMRMHGKEKPGEQPKSTLQQEAIALDYTANIAAGAQILSEKWNQTHKAGMTVNNGHPKWIENWFFALWAYNSGFYPTADSAGHWGVGWTNNPANPLWKANRLPFLESGTGGDDYSHAAHPQDWPYEEKVIGWAARPIAAMFGPGDIQAGYRPAWWNSNSGRTAAKPPVDLFCDASNNCDPSKIADGDSNDPGLGACTLDAGDSKTNPHWLHCWWNKSAEWKSCDVQAQCGYQVHRFNTSYPEQPDANSYPPRCSHGLPSGTLVIDDLPNGVTPAGSGSRGCGPVKSDGTFAFDFVEWNGTYPGKIDTHQIGAAYGNHFWFTHARQPESYPGNAYRMKVTGTWKLGKTVPGGQAEVYAHIPDHGAQTMKAVYEIKTAFGVKTKAISQTDNSSNKWVSLGAYRFNSTIPEVKLSNFNGTGTGDKDIAWDAIAFVPGDYTGMPDISFSGPDLLAPTPGDITTPEDVTEDFIPLSASNNLAKSPSTDSTSSAGKNTKTDVAPSTSKPSKEELEDAENRLATASAANSGVDWCGIKPFPIPYALPNRWINRTEGCLKTVFNLTQRDLSTDEIIGTARIHVQAEIKTNPSSGTIETDVFFIPVAFTGTGATGPVTQTVEQFCSIDCTSSTQNWVTSATWNWGAGDRHVAHMRTTHTWNQSQSSITDLIGFKWKFGGWMGGEHSGNLSEMITGTPQQIRCDNIVTATPGCVFDRYKPTYVMNSKKFPAAAAHAWLVQQKLPGHFGLKGKGAALRYLGTDVMSPTNPNKKQSDANRDVICPSSYVRHPDATLSPELSSSGTDTQSCDEFAFASSYQSAGMPTSMGGTNPVSSGNECLQTVAKKGTDGIWRIYADERYPLPEWNEKCGRSSMSNNQNTQSMSPFPGFRKRNRLIGKDEYWLDVPKPT